MKKIISLIFLLLFLTNCAPANSKPNKVSLTKRGPACFENEQGEEYCVNQSSLERVY